MVFRAESSYAARTCSPSCRVKRVVVGWREDRPLQLRSRELSLYTQQADTEHAHTCMFSPPYCCVSNVFVCVSTGGEASFLSGIARRFDAKNIGIHPSAGSERPGRVVVLL